MIRAIYQKARDAIRAAGDDISKAEKILDRQVRASQALREEALEVGVKQAVMIGLRYERDAARDGKTLPALVGAQGLENGGAGDRGPRETQSSYVLSPPVVPSDSKAAGPGTTGASKPEALLSPSQPPPSRAATAYRNASRIYPGMLGYRLHSAPNRVIGEADRDAIRAEIAHESAKHATKDAYLHFLGGVQAVLVKRGGVVSDHITPDAAQTMYESGRMAFGQRIQRYLAAGGAQ